MLLIFMEKVMFGMRHHQSCSTQQSACAHGEDDVVEDDDIEDDEAEDDDIEDDVVFCTITYGINLYPNSTQLKAHALPSFIQDPPTNHHHHHHQTSSSDVSYLKRVLLTPTYWFFCTYDNN